MPDAWSHILCGTEILDLIEDDKYKKVIMDNIKSFNLGAQGPDIFLYYPFWKQSKYKWVKYPGDLLHTEKTKEFILKGLNFLNENITREDKDFEIFYAYFIGYITHYSLDNNCHPFVYYFAGVYDKNNPITKKYDVYHKKFEMIIDTIMVKKKLNKEAYRSSLHKELDVGKGLPKIIATFYEKAFKEVYNIDITEEVVQRNYKYMKRIIQIFNGISTLAMAIGNINEAIIKKPVKYKYIIYPKRIDESIDYLNLEHKTWVHPCDDREKITKSFLELYDESVVEGGKMVNEAIEFLSRNIGYQDLESYIPNKSFITGKPLEENSEMKFYKCIFH